MLKNTKRILALLFSIYFITLNFYLFTYWQEEHSLLVQIRKLNRTDPFQGLNSFVHIQLSQDPPFTTPGLIYTIVSFIIIPLFGSLFYIYQKDNATFNFLPQRISYPKYLKKGFLSSFLGGFLLSLFTSIYEIIFVKFTLSGINYSVNGYFKEVGIPSFSNNTLIEVVSIIVLNALGWGIYSMFIFALNLYIPKIIFSIPSGFLFFLIITLLISTFGNRNSLVMVISGTLFPEALVSPGFTTFYGLAYPINYYLQFILSAVFYICLALVLAVIWKKRRLKYGKN
ncbi:hypothetical protein [Lactobacillus sp. PV012]|uniref:hypothetical protein n=1 Tax=Lactobacillus sp. PV012 TaxID=2594494 RepID=UPI0022408B72|nr:hypothetical protein [Lactobacillus sp. PV012]QNQ81573.1 hypothetical protein FP433_00160 [Lactobacillus sp. PV012]